MFFHDAYLCTAIAETRSPAVVFPKQPFLKALKHSPELTKALMLQLPKRLHESKMLLELRSICSAHQRVLHYLQLLIKPQRNSLILDRLLKDIALNMGLTPEALSRSLKYLQEISLSESDRLKHLLQKILSYAKPQPLQLSRLNISEFLKLLLIHIQELPEAVDRRIDFESHLPAGEVMADINKLKQVFINVPFIEHRSVD